MPPSKKLLRRLKHEFKLLEDPPPGVSVWPHPPGSLTNMRAQIEGPGDTPYEAGVFELEIAIPERYPFEPPKLRFLTPIYHPNIDNAGRICHDALKMPPAGAWNPSHNVSNLLTTIRFLIASPNADDGLMPDITQLYTADRATFESVARQHTLQHATGPAKPAPAAAPAPGPSAVPSSSASASTFSSSPAAGAAPSLAQPASPPLPQDDGSPRRAVKRRAGASGGVAGAQPGRLPGGAGAAEAAAPQAGGLTKKSRVAGRGARTDDGGRERSETEDEGETVQGEEEELLRGGSEVEEGRGGDCGSGGEKNGAQAYDGGGGGDDDDDDSDVEFLPVSRWRRPGPP